MRKSRISKAKQLRLMEHFVAGITASCASSLVGLNKNSAAYYFQRLRGIISLQKEQEANEFFGGKIEVDESYFGGKRKGNRGRGAMGKLPVFGLLKRGGQVYTKIIPDASSATLIPILSAKLSLIVLFIRTAGLVIMCWMCQTLSTTTSIIQSSSVIRKTILMALRTFGTKRRDI